MICRVWHGWTSPDRADQYEALLRAEVFPGILAKNVPGLSRIELFRRRDGDEVAFMTLMWFERAEDIRAFAGEDAKQAYVPAAARAILSRFDSRARHFELRHRREPG